MAAQRAADAAAAASVSLAGWTWVTQANEILQLIATAVAIVAGLLAARYHWTKTQVLKSTAVDED